MEIIRARNVEDAYHLGIQGIKEWGVEQDSRAGKVLVAPFPVMTVYEKPRERVLFDPGRDANPFFHLFECLWILAGRDDAEWLDKLVHDFGSRFAEPNGTIYGAYGYRFRRKFKFDQIECCIERLKENPLDRRVVLQMWDAYGDLVIGVDAKDLPCNTQIYLRVIDGKLDLTVCCRSNDIIWGAYGANAVHFSVLQEYIAGRLGIQMGRLYQLSNNWHAYVDVLNKVGEPTSDRWYQSEEVSSVLLGHDWENWDQDLFEFMKWTDRVGEYPPRFYNWWFNEVAGPLYLSHHIWKAGNRETAFDTAQNMCRTDWREAAICWMQRRMK